MKKFIVAFNGVNFDIFCKIYPLNLDFSLVIEQVNA